MPAPPGSGWCLRRSTPAFQRSATTTPSKKRCASGGSTASCTRSTTVSTSSLHAAQVEKRVVAVEQGPGRASSRRRLDDGSGRSGSSGRQGKRVVGCAVWRRSARHPARAAKGPQRKHRRRKRTGRRSRRASRNSSSIGCRDAKREATRVERISTIVELVSRGITAARAYEEKLLKRSTSPARASSRDRRPRK